MRRASSGLRVYGTLAALGWFQRLGVLHLPSGLAVLGEPLVVGVASALYVVEFIADKIPALDSIWDAIHTFVRIPAAALVAFAALGQAPESWRVAATLLAGGVALSVHGLKAGARLAVNASPEPFSNWSLSFGEELSAAGLLYLVVAHPGAALACAGVLLALGIALAWWIARSLRRLLRRRPENEFSGSDPEVSILGQAPSFASAIRRAALPSSSPLWAFITRPITLPTSFAPVAPELAIASSTQRATVASSARLGRKAWITPSSARSAAASSGRPPLVKASMLSWRCFSSLRRTP